jgi:hypothetical protein
MDFGGVDKRRSKKDLKRKRLHRVYKKGGQFRSANVDEVEGEERDKMGKVIKKKKKGAGKAKKRKY